MRNLVSSLLHTPPSVVLVTDVLGAQITPEGNFLFFTFLVKMNQSRLSYSPWAAMIIKKLT